MHPSLLHRRAWLQSVAGTAASLSAASYLRAAGANKRFRVAVIGRTGRGNYGHSLDKVWRNVPETQLIAVADDDPQGLADAAARLKLDKAYGDYRQMLEREKPEIVCIAQRWLDKHHEMAMACAERGIHIYMEKPFVPTLQQSDELVALCQQHKVKLALACQSHYSPRVQMAKQLIAEGKIGRVLEFRGRGKEDHRGGSEDLWVLGTHVLDLIRYLGGQPTSCFATLTEQGRPVEKSDVRDGNEGLGPLAGDSVQASYTLPDGATAFFASRRNMGKGEDRFGVQIFGSEGIIEIMWGYLASVLYLPDPQWSPGRSGKKWLNVSSTGIDQPEPNPKPGNAEGNRIAVLDLLDAIQTDREPLCGLTAAAGTLEMIHAVFESHRLKKPTPLPLTTRQHPLTLL